MTLIAAGRPEPNRCRVWAQLVLTSASSSE